jgi:hypothetical protein
MKKFVSFCLTFLLLQSVFCFVLLSSSATAQLAPALPTSSQETINNQSVVEMVKSGFSETLIVTKIKSSKSSFDTTTSALQELKNSGVSESIIMAMVQQSSGISTSSSNSESGSVIDVTIPDGTEVEVQLKNNLSGQDSKLGEIVDLVVVRDIEVNGRKVILQGSSATARITNAKKAGYWGKKGKLEWAMQDIQTASGARIPARFTKAVDGESRSGTVAVGAVVTTVLLGPVGLLWGLKKGKKAEIPAGTKFSVYVDKDASIQIKDSRTNL